MQNVGSGPNIWARRLFVRQKSQRSFAHYATQYLDLIAGKSSKTVALVEYIFRHLIPAFGSTKVSDITAYELKKYIANKSKKYKVYNHLKYFKAVISVARDQGIALASFDSVKCPDAVSEKLKVYTPQEYGKLLWACRTRRLWKCRLFIFIAVTTALRKSEILGLRWEWIRLDEGEMHLPANYFKHTKRNLPRIIPLNSVLLIILKARRKRFLLDVHVFPCKATSQGRLRDDIPLTDIDRTWERVTHRAGIVGSMHSLRATAATWIAIALGGDKLLTLSLVRMTEEVFMRHYLHVPQPQAKYVADYAIKIARMPAADVVKLIRDPASKAIKSAA